MPFIGVQPATVPLTSSDITDGIISTAKIADDAVGNTKLDLSANYAFTGTITGVGKVLQNVTADTTTQVSITSTTFTDSGLTASITPSSTSNKIAIFIHQGVYIARGGTGDLMGAIRLLRDSTVINQGYSDSTGGLNPYFALGTSQAMYVSYWNSFIMLDSPSTTSSVTYKTQGNLRNTGNSHVMTFQQSSSTTNKSTIILQEIQS